ncbi:MAG TPA: hypothetical protein VK975_03110, partial [Acidimicrobiales bacterium]|nr:hypothetical protein [Acidimicrobiales bacterium]
MGAATLPWTLVWCGVGSSRRGAGLPEPSPPKAAATEEGHLTARPHQPDVPTPTATGETELELSDGGRAIVYAPTTLRPDQPSPLAVMFHGAGGTAEDGLGILRGLADDAGLILLAPKSQGRTWDLVLGGYGPDVALLDEALNQVFDRYAVDPAHLAVGGFSDGASYALSVGTVNGRLFTHVIAFSPGFWVPGRSEGSPSYFITHGTDDEVLPIASTSRRLV